MAGIRLALACLLIVSSAATKFDPSDATSAPLADFFSALTHTHTRTHADTAKALEICMRGDLPRHAGIRMPVKPRTLGRRVHEDVRSLAVAAAAQNRDVSHAHTHAHTHTYTHTHTHTGEDRGVRDEGIIAHLLNLLPSSPDVIQLIACLIEKDVVDIATDTPDNGAALVYVCGMRTHVRLCALLLGRGAGIGHVDHADAGFTALHAGLTNRLLNLDMVQKLLVPAGNASQVTARRAYYGWLYNTVRSAGVHSGAEPDVAAARDALEALAAFFQLPVAALLQDGDKGDGAAPRALLPLPSLLAKMPTRLDHVNMSHVNAVSNVLATLFLRVWLDAAERRAVTADGSAREVLRVLRAADRYGRTPLHVAAISGNTAAASLLLQSIGRMAALQFNQSHVSGGSKSVSVSFTGETTTASKIPRTSHRRAALLELADALTAEDVNGHSPGNLATVYARHSTAAFLADQTTAISGIVPVRALATDLEGAQSGVSTAPATAFAITGGWGDASRLSSDFLATAVGERLSRGDEETQAALANDCGAEVLPGDVDAETFYRRVYLRNRPALLRGAARNWTLVSALARDTLLQRIGQLRMPSSAIPYAHTFGRASDSMTVRDFVAALEAGSAEIHAQTTQQYAFGSPTKAISTDDDEDHDALLQMDLATELLRHVPLTLRALDATVPVHAAYLATLPFGNVTEGEALHANGTLLLPHLKTTVDPLIVTPPFPKPQFYLGPAGSGAPMHVHKDAWNVLAHGQKRWYLLPPSMSEYSAEPIAAWVARSSGGRSFPGIVQCTQNAGDVMYVPHGWGHAVLNLHTSIGVAVEFTSALSIY